VSTDRERQDGPVSKFCPGCREDKPVALFGPNRTRPDGLSYYCKVCFSAVNARSYRKRRAAAGKKVREPRQSPPGQRWCPDCEDFQPLREFGFNQSTPTGVTAYCRRHQNARIETSRAARHGSGRNYRLKHRYGITAEEADLMRTRQAGVCPICVRPLGENAHVDHDHATGRVRGLLCFTCNAGLGNFADEVSRLGRAAEYLTGTLRAPSVVRPGYLDWQSRAWRRPDSRVESMIERVIQRRVGSPT
jgi:hypothetical protein